MTKLLSQNVHCAGCGWAGGREGTEQGVRGGEKQQQQQQQQQQQGARVRHTAQRRRCLRHPRTATQPPSPHDSARVARGTARVAGDTLFGPMLLESINLW